MKKVLYDEYVSKMKECFQYYKKNNLKNAYYKFYLPSKKTNLIYMIPTESVANLLGINTSFLQRKRLVKGQSSYEAVEEFLEKANSIYHHFNGEVENIFLDNITEKLSMFKKNVGFNFNEIEFIGEIDCKKIDFNHYDGEFIDASYIVIRYFKEEDCYSALLLKKNDKGTLCSVASMGHTVDMAPYEIYVKNQNCYVPESGNICTNLGETLLTVYFNLNQKIEKMNHLFKIKDKYQFSLCVEKEYLELLENKYKEAERMENILKMITLLCNKEKLLSYDEICEIIEDKDIVEAFNPLIAQLQNICEQNYNFWMQLKQEIEKRQNLEVELFRQQEVFELKTDLMDQAPVQASSLENVSNETNSNESTSNVWNDIKNKVNPFKTMPKED